MKVRDGARQTMAWLHGWAGLLLGWVLYVIAFAGTLALFKPEIGQWMRPENRAVAPPAEALAAAIGWLQAHKAASPAWYLTAPTPRMNTVEAMWSEGATYPLRALDPVSGAPALRETIGGEFFYRLHFELQLPYPWGRLTAAFAATMMLLALISGIIAHRRFFRDFFTFRPGRGQRAWLDGHNALGVLALPFHLMITFTGIVTLATLFMPWGIMGNYGADQARMFRDFSPAALERPAAGRPGHLAPILPMLHEAERRFGGTIGRVTVLNPGDAASLVQVVQSDLDGLAQAPHMVTFDGPSGRVLADHAERRPAVMTYNLLYGLHMARFAPGLLRWLYFAGGMALTGGIATGLVLWIVKRREKAPLGQGNRLAERLNVAVIAGLPLAFASLFVANRLLPIGLPGRAQAEVSATLWTWLGASITGLLLPPRIGWPTLLGLAGLTSLAAPLLGLVGRPYPTPVGVGLMLALSGAALLAIAYAARKKAA